VDLHNTNNNRPSGAADSADNGHEEAAGITVADVSFTLFRHKWLILGFVCLGLLGAVAVRYLRPPPYVSWAKLMVLYVENNKDAGPVSSGGQVIQIDSSGQNAINTEVEILGSADVAEKVADLVGPEKILAKRGGGSDRDNAANVVHTGMEVENPKGTSILTISFRNRDKSIVQPVLSALLATYMEKQHEVRKGGTALEEYYTRMSTELRSKLAATEEELKSVKTNGILISVEETQHAFQTELAKLQTDLREAQIDLASRRAVLGDVPAPTTNGTPSTLTASAEKITDYGDTVRDLESLRRQYRNDLKKFKPAFPAMQNAKAQIEELERHQADLERESPGLSLLAVAAVKAGGGGTNGGVSDLDEIRRLNAKVTIISTMISNLQSEATRVIDLEPRLADLTRLRNSYETNLTFFSAACQRAMVDRELGAGAGSMSMVQKPTSPDLDYKKIKKLMGGVLGACVACGLALAFLIDFVLRRTIRRSADIERHMGLPVFQAIPDTAYGARPRLTFNGGDKGGPGHTEEIHANGSASEELSVAVWRSGHDLEAHIAGLRERLMTHFEVNNLNQKKPKLVAVTGCSAGAGVSTLSGGLAAALSETGTGNVLLVDMTGTGGSAQSFFKGQPGPALGETLQPDHRDGAKVKENLYLARMDASVKETNNDKLSRALPPGFGHLVPALKASDYDYVIFDMPPVTPTSSTARLASHMDLVLMVVESEKTGQQVATRASTLLRGSRAKVAAVLNKFRQHAPEALSPDP
jgi:uncharacterized protein involved in exopolysaccharide biosynthesis/Mrp family chromosome partitioning ATPase